ncbi:MAG TPA: hypothetical protein VK514_13215 [Candidatus Acidoferrum sp.]|nr:hypothetical protein [Candidatus Acidoferrum sp.]
MEVAGFDLTKLAQELLDGKERHRERTQQIDRPYGPTVNERSKVVRLDAVVMAMHIMAAKLALKDFAGTMKGMLESIQKHVNSYGVKKAIGATGEAVGKAGQRLAGTARRMADVLDADLLELAKEISIRKAGWKSRRDVFVRCLSQTRHRVRKTKLVATRHPSKKQRKANKSWHQPR